MRNSELGVPAFGGRVLRTYADAPTAHSLATGSFSLRSPAAVLHPLTHNTLSF